MRITILQGAFFPVPPVRGGAVEKLWHQLGIAFANRGHVVTQISRKVPELPETDSIDGVRHMRVSGYDQPSGTLGIKWCDFRYTRRALWVAPPADILVTNTFWAPLLAGPKLGRIHVSVERMPKGQMRFYRRAARLRACSQAVGEAIKCEAPSLANRVVVIPNPLPFVPDRPAETRLSPDGILYVGRIHPIKGIELLLTAFVRAKDSGAIRASSRLTLVGPADTARGGGGETWWSTLLGQFIRTDIQWIGPIYDVKELDKHYRSAAVLVYPTLDEAGEAMPVTPLEGMAWGCIPVVSDLACFRDYIVPSKNGFVFDHRASEAVENLAAVLMRALSTSGQSMAAAAIEVRDSHAVKTIADQFLSDFETINTLR
jgi:glycosyltransferase involved in cell wall biosynthesis